MTSLPASPLPPHPAPARSAIALGVGLLLLVVGALKLLGALGFTTMMLETDRTGGLFGIKFGFFFVVVVGVPVGLSGAFDLAAGIGTVRRQGWGYGMGIVSGAVAALAWCAPILATLAGGVRGLSEGSATVDSSVSALVGVAIFGAGVALNVFIVIALVRALTAPRR